MAQRFRINRLGNKYRVDIKILLWYCPLVYVFSFQDCIGVVTWYSTQVFRTRKAIIHDDEGPNKVMKIKYEYNWFLDMYFKRLYNGRLAVKTATCELSKGEAFLYLYADAKLFLGNLL